MGELYRAVWRTTGRDQFLLIGLSLLVAALAAVPLKFQQLAINSLVEGGSVPQLAWLCAGFLGAVLLSASVKFLLGLRLAVVGERVVLLIRQRLYENQVADTARDPRAAGRRGALVAMLTAEAEMVGAFAGAAISTPVVQIGTLISVIGFIAFSQPWLGVMALAVVIPQAAIVLAIQHRINGRVRERVQALRDASDRISRSDLDRVEAEVLADFQTVYDDPPPNLHAQAVLEMGPRVRSVPWARWASCSWAAGWSSKGAATSARWWPASPGLPASRGHGAIW